MENDKKLFLLDAFALIYRAYFAFSNNHRINSKGLNTSAMLGFTNTLVELLKKEKPTHIAVVFDTSAPTQRHVDFVEYKANREEMPDDLKLSIPYIIKIIEGFNIPVIAVDGFEADDVIGTLAKKAEQKGYSVYMMTPDKDYGQLVSSNIFIYKPARLGNGVEIMGVAEVCKKWDIENVDQVIDLLGLMGDKVDNIPGIPGVGEKTAVQLIKEFGSMENMLQNTDKLKGKLKEKVEQNIDKAILSKKLAAIICDVPIAFEEEKTLIGEINKQALNELFLELEFRRLAEQVLGSTIFYEQKMEVASSILPKGTTIKTNKAQTDLFATEEESSETLVAEEVAEPEVKNYNTIANTQHEYFLVDTAEKQNLLLELLKQQTVVCFDTETTGLNTLTAELVGVSFAFEISKAYYIPIPASKEESKKILELFKPIFESEIIMKVGQNIKYDLSILKQYGININGPLFDTMIAHFLIQPEMRHNMNVLSETYLNYSPISIETLIGKKGKNQLNMRDVSFDKITEYAAEDADITLQLYHHFKPLIGETSNQKLLSEVEIPLISVLADMEREGIRLDTKALNQFSSELEIEIANIDKEIQTLAGTSFNISSPKQVGEILFEYLKIIDKPKKTKTGQYATGEDVLVKLENKHPIVKKILEYRELQKLKSTYVDAFPLLVNKETGRIHTSYNQVVAVTGRLSSDNPNLQNIPIRSIKGREVRKAFVPRNEEYTLLSADYSQIELRIVASISKDEAMCDAFKRGVDIHTSTAAKVFKVSESDVTKEMRYKAKSVNFGIIYGQGAFGLAENISVSRTEAKEIIDSYKKEFSGIQRYMDETIDFARSNGYVETLLGRRRWLRDINSANFNVRGFAERNAINSPIQGSAADMIKIAMINIHNEFEARQLTSKMLLQVHDELVFDVYLPELELVKELVAEKMKTALLLNVPIEVGIGVGSNWLEAH